MVKSYRWGGVVGWWGGGVVGWWGGVVAYGILVSPQSQLDFGFFTSLGLGLGLGLGGQGLGLGLDNSCLLLELINTTCSCSSH